MKRKNIVHLLILCFGFLFFNPQLLLSQEIEDPLVVTLIAEDETIQPGRPFTVALRIKMQDHWHSYWKNPGDSGMPTSIEWELPPGFTAAPIEWPYPQRFDLDSILGYGYEGDVWLLAQINPPPTLVPSSEMTLKAQVRWLVCSYTTCLPGISEPLLQMTAAPSNPGRRKEWVTAFEAARAKLPSRSWSVHAERSGPLIQLSLGAPFPSSQKFDQALFFPENSDAIDTQIEPIIEMKAGRPVVTLKGREEGSAPSENLKGVLVLVHAKGKEAIAVDASLNGASEEPIALADTPRESALMPISDASENRFGMILLFAFVGGMILNLMPCVLPVVSFKILEFVKMAGQSRTKTLQHGAAFAAGVIASFWVLAGLLLLLQAYGHSVGWGFQLQEPLFVALLAALLLAFGLSLFGLFEIGTSLIGVAADAQQGRTSGLTSSFLGGVLATTVATPCTGPFLGTALGFAVTLPPLAALSIFTFVGFGMAAPYVALTAFPALLRFLPKPGAWMVTFKELMGFLMLGTVLWLTWVFGAQTDSLGIFLLLSSFFFIALAGWFYGKWGAAARKKQVRIVGLVCALFCLMLAGYALLEASQQHGTEIVANETSTSSWEPFSAERIAELQKQGTPIFVDFTAKWCLICQANHLVLSVKEVEEAFDRLGVVRMKADWTRGDAAITAALKKQGRNSVPLYLFYGANPEEPPQILPQVLTPEVVLKPLQEFEKMAQR